MPARNDGATTRDRILDAFEMLLVEGGVKIATLDAVAARAEVSKGGLLYHFPSKDAMADAMLDRLREQGRADVLTMKDAPQGPVRYYLETSVDTGSAFDRGLIAASRLAQDDVRARETLAELRNGWFAVLAEHYGDDALARTVQLIGDGLYFDDTTGLAHKRSLDHVRDVLGRLDAL
ncbi:MULTISPECIES: TetR/AcrR family transcriptional regulator [Mumia]|uniref:TetR/AcrR family transcriptional regulator n=1 Tax=Mumia TaxID=1546255 RepID=UPI00142092F0|nr:MULTISPECIES: TetR/AcrR family transcriptional regulator [unclassified Mumia]QMW66481.1 TetR/AcrR family transcriptional regulator [Mumia sp. ZJ1417]